MSKKLARKIASRRKECGLNQRDAAVQAGLSQAYISKLEDGGVQDVKDRVLVRLAYALQVSLDWYGIPGLQAEISAQDPRVESMFRSFMTTVEDHVRADGGDPAAEVEVSDQSRRAAQHLMAQWQKDGLWDIANLDPEVRQRMEDDIAAAMERQLDAMTA